MVKIVHLRLAQKFTIILFLFFVLTLISCNDPNIEPIARFAKVNNTSEMNFWSADTFRFPGSIRPLFLLGSSNGLLFINDEETIYYFKKNKAHKLFSNGLKINLTAIDGDNLFFVTETREFQYSDKIFWMKLDITGEEVKVNTLQEVPFVFSEGIYGIRFLNKNMVLILGLQEFSIVELKGDEIVSVKHYPLEINPASQLSFSKRSKSNSDLLLSKDTVYSLNNKKGSPNLVPLFAFPDPLLSPSKIEYPSGFIDLSGDENFGICHRNNKLYVYNKDNGKYEFTVLDSLYLSTGEVVPVSLFGSFALTDKKNIWLSLTNGKILKNIYSGETFNNTWELIFQTALGGIENGYVIDSTHIYVLEPPFLYLLTKKANPRLATNRNRHKDNNSFTINSYEKLSTIYGCGVSDFNNDGKEELYLIDLFEINGYYINLKKQLVDQYLVNEASKYGLGGKEIDKDISQLKYAMDIGLSIGDIDESGSEDILVTNLEGPNFLMLNNGDGYFQNATKQFSLDVDMHRSEGAAIADVNNDGYLDIFFTGYLYTNRLFINDNGVKFIDKTEEYGLTSKWGSINAVFGDINNDGFPDLYVANWMTDNKLYLNNGNGSFKDISKESNTACGNLKRSNSVAFVDFNNDGYLDLFVGNRDYTNMLFINKGNLKFENVTQEAGITGKFRTYGTACADFNNDGLIDIFVTNKGIPHLFINAEIRDNIPIFRDFTDYTIREDFTRYKEGKGAAYLDYNTDGLLDIVYGQYQGSFLTLTNSSTESNNFIDVKVIGSKSNRSGIGTKLKLFHKDSLIAYREVCSNSGYASSSTTTQHFGIGNLDGEFIVEAEFPASEVKRKVKVLPGSLITIKEYEGVKEYYFIVKKSLIKFITGGDFTFQLGKFIIFLAVFSLILMSFRIKYFRYKFKMINKAISVDRLKLFIVSVVTYFISLAVIEIIFLIHPDYVGWINSSRNIFVMDVVPILNAVIVIPLYLLKSRETEIEEVTGRNILKELLLLIEGFHHGESSAMNLNRLSLYTKNIDSISGNDNQLFERFVELINEFNNSTYNDLITISMLAENLSNDSRFADVSSIMMIQSKELNRATKRLMENLSHFYPLLSEHDIEKLLIAPYKSSTISMVNEIKTHIDFFIKTFEQKISCRISDVLENVKQKFSYEHKEQFSLAINYPADDAELIITFSELTKIILNLAQNSIEAFDFNNGKDKNILITTSREGKIFFISVKDNGMGIKETDIPHIFNIGFTTKSGGHGFGLYWISQVVDSYGGAIEVNSEYGKYTDFVVRLKML